MSRSSSGRSNEWSIVFATSRYSSVSIPTLLVSTCAGYGNDRAADDRDRQLSFPGWLEHAAAHPADFGPDDVAELQEDAVIAAVHDQVTAGLDTISDGEQTCLDFNLGFYGFLEGIEQGEALAPARPPAHDQRAKHRVVGELSASRGLGTVEEFERLRRSRRRDRR